jgi:hypothetical protein
VDDPRVLYRAIRSYQHNRQLLPAIERRLDTAQAKIKAALLVEEGPIRLGPFRIEMDQQGRVTVEQIATDDGWEQLVIDDLEGEIE